MALILKQYPLWSISTHQGAQPIGQQLIWSVIDTNIVANFFNVKYVAEVYVSNDAIVWSAAQKIGTFKTTPNNAGAGIWDFRSVLETFLNPDHLGSTLGAFPSTYKSVQDLNQPIHLIDKCSRSDNSIKYVAIRFNSEGSITATGTVTEVGNAISSSQHTFFNGVLQYDNVLELHAGSYGFPLQKNKLMPSSTYGESRFLTNSPTTQYANLEDYGTFAFLNFMPQATDRLSTLQFEYYNSDGDLLDSENVNTGIGNGGASSLYNANTQLLYAGVFPGNLRNHSTKFNALVSAGTIQGGYYTIQGQTSLGLNQQLYTINLNCPTNLGYEPIRLTWLNQWGVWDYYTFIQKSIKSISTKRTPYSQMSGTWNEETLAISGYQGGRKNFRVNTSEKIRMNTAYVTEEEGKWFEELINSPEVYILNGFDGSEVAPYNTITNKYVEPVTLTTSSYTKKTTANDKLMQYTFEVEKSKNRRTQAV
jgi:hypothetical protein